VTPQRPPGECVSVDQYGSALHGRIRHTRGKEKRYTQYNCVNLFVDHATTYIHHRHQVSLHVIETLKTKHNFEKFSSGQSRATMPIMIPLEPATSGIISNFRIKSCPFPDMALIIKMVSLSTPSKRQQNGPGPYSSMIFCIGHRLLLSPMFSNSGIMQWTIPSIYRITYLAKIFIALP
jgi:hypothetical protein